jgi:c(7)-type cytochrome triheme protein
MWRVGLPLKAAQALVLACSLAIPAAAGAAVPPPLKLPADIVYSRRVGPDSAVTFRHGTHVAIAGNRCLGCHPAPFRMLSPARRTTHSEMATGGSCGRCHDGTHAFGIGDPAACQTCHAGRGSEALAVADGNDTGGRSIPRRKSSPVVPFRRGDASPGLVTFRHARHEKAAPECATCHPKPFAMRATGGRPGGAMHEGGACGGCHDGARAFGVEDAEACARCHVEGAAR